MKSNRRLVFGVSVYLEGSPDSNQLKSCFIQFCQQFPVLRGRDARCWCLAPYWKYSGTKVPRVPEEIRVGGCVLQEHESTSDFSMYIEQAINKYAVIDGWHVALEIIQSPDASKSMLLFMFDHCLFDAKGADAFIQLFLQHFKGAEMSIPESEKMPRADAQLDDWGSRFKSGRDANRCIRKLMNAETANLPLPQDLKSRPIRIREICFTPEESKRIQERAFAVAGYLMFAPYVLATAVSAFYPVFDRLLKGNFDFVVSTSTDKQRTAVRKQHVFFNDLSFLFFQFPMSAAADRNTLAVILRNQLVQQARDGLPAVLEEANLLMRIFPAKILWQFLMKYYRNRMSSLAFTSLGEPQMNVSEVAGCRVLDYIHFPMIPTPPGLGLILCQHADKIHAVLSYFDGVISDEDVQAVLARFREQILT
ncbi:MAG: hypothetical protein WCP12_05860 [bacterium]